MVALLYPILAAPLMAAVIVRTIDPMVGPLPYRRRESGLHERQTQIIVPSECASICNPIIDTIDSCPTAECACTTPNMDGLFNCLECIVTVRPTILDVANAQADLNRFAEECAVNGIPLAVPTVTAGKASSTNGPTSTSADGNPPTGIPLSFGGATFPTTTTSHQVTVTSQTGAQTSTVGSEGGTGNRSGAMRDEGMSIRLFVMIVVVVLVG
ncbi:hypothetical protein F5148DRAFT_1232250 [Russula earlei]|uniref:Uncharacterized protein n=1 Tax=Russula earlei TaxID=71964 RepID=A0ACC0TYP5_9AGAM|nr:hypothetical protein F5148DRAFT_1232250 [Russula earlei]